MKATLGWISCLRTAAEDIEIGDQPMPSWKKSSIWRFSTSDTAATLTPANWCAAKAILNARPLFCSGWRKLDGRIMLYRQKLINLGIPSAAP